MKYFDRKRIYDEYKKKMDEEGYQEMSVTPLIDSDDSETKK